MQHRATECAERPTFDPQEQGFRRDIAALVFFTLLGCYAYFWQARCWNSASRLMLTYAVGDRGSIMIDGFEMQTRDRALIDGHYYCDKPPGHSFLGIPFYLLAKLTGVRHPVDRPPFPYWWPDYLVTILTSGVLTAALGVALYAIALSVGCTQGAAVLVALSYGLATPAFTYATLYYGHQSAAFCAFLAFYLLDRIRRRATWSAGGMFVAGLLAGYAVIAEYPMVFVSVGLFVWAWTITRSIQAMSFFSISAALCALGLGIYHTAAFGGPLQLGYFNETEAQFQEIYSEENPIGLTMPSPRAAIGILFSAHGLFLFAPITVLSVVGMFVLASRRQWSVLLMVIWSFGSLFLVNASHPTWTGGFSTGPRYVLPGVPFLMVAVAAALTTGGAWMLRLAGVLGVIGFVVVLSCTAYGGRLPDLGTPGGDNPLFESIWPAWGLGHFDRNLGKLLLYRRWWDIPATMKWVSLVPLALFLAAMLSMLAIGLRRNIRISTPGQSTR